jgi:NAD(P)-dependent dehydrogenase (short-subunit alcohol dehydrogenase family)
MRDEPAIGGAGTRPARAFRKCPDGRAARAEPSNTAGHAFPGTHKPLAGLPKRRRQAHCLTPRGRDGTPTVRVCIVGASGKLGKYMVQHALDRGYEVVGVCREQSVEKLDPFKGRVTVVPGATNDPTVIKRAVEGCDGVLVVLVPRGVHGYSSGTAQAVLDHAPPGARLVFSCGWHITRDGQDVYSWKLKALVKVGGPLARLARFADLDDQVEACRRVFASDTRWTVVRGSDLEGGREPGPARVEPARGRPPSSRATSRAASTSPSSWWRPSRTTISSTRPRRSSAPARPRRLRTPPANEPLNHVMARRARGL